MTDVIAALTPEQLDAIVKGLDCDKEKLPVETIHEARRHKGQIIPELIKLLQHATQALRQHETVKGNGAFLALFLLAEFRAAEGLPAILDALSLPGEGPFEMFGDGIHEAMPRVLVSLGKDDCLEICCTLYRNAALNQYVRWAAAKGLVYMAMIGTRPRAEIVGLCRQLLVEQMERGDAKAVSAMIITMLGLNPWEATQEIHDAFQRHLVDEWMVDLKSANENLQDKPMERTYEYRDSEFIEDTVKELEDWACFQPDEGIPPSPSAKPALPTPVIRPPDLPLPKQYPVSRPHAHVGRNDPCPCGSGKKFKRCCLGRR